MPPLLHVQLSAGYGSSTVLHQVDLSVEPGDRLGLVGTSGAGKSTLVLALLGLLPWRRGWAKGEVLFEGRNLLTMPEREARTLRGRRIALVPQSPMSSLNAAVSLRTHFEQAWKAHKGGPDLNARLDRLMGQMQLSATAEFLKRKPGQISVGQAQRCVIALALLHSPALLIADEPTSALDPATQAEILDLLADMSRTDRTALLYISHDLLSVLRLCDRLAVLDRGHVVECLDVATLEQEARDPATRALLATLPAPASVLLGYRRTPLKLE